MILSDKSKNRVLLVDDGLANLKIAESHLVAEGLLVTTASNGADALKYAEETEFDLILLDVMMPEMDGFEVCRKLKENKATKETPVIFLTVLSSSNDIVNGFEVGGVDYITKPFNALEMIARVRAHLQYRKSRKQLLSVNHRQEVAEQDLLTLLEAVHSGILIVDPDDNSIVDVNAAALSVLEQPLDQLVGHDYTDIFTPASTDNNILESTDTDLFCIEAKLKTVSGREYDVIQKVTEVETSEKIYYLVNFIDITDRKYIELLREDIGRIIQHDLKGPLNAVVALPEILRENFDEDGQESKLLTLIEAAGYQMLDMINLSLDMYKMECRTYEVQAVPVELVQIMNRIDHELHSYKVDKNVLYNVYINNTLACSDSSFFVMAEDLLCYSMLSNIIKNAVEACYDNEVISVNIDSSDVCRIVVHNERPVPEDVINSFFDKYSTSGKKKGTGLGTYSAKLIAETLGGTIKMDSFANSGTTITIELPLP